MQAVIDKAEAGRAGPFDYWLVFLPRCSPMLNPIEECFNDMKHEVRDLLDDPCKRRC
jgi:transposase